MNPTNETNTPTTKENISDLEQENKTDQNETKKFYNYINVILMNSQRKKLLIMSFLAFTFSISYYGILLEYMNNKTKFFLWFFYEFHR